MNEPLITLGGGNWAIKPESLLGFNTHTEWGFNPKHFDVQRNSTATYINKDGFVKTAGINEATIDFLDDAGGYLVCEPERTNLIKYSYDLTQHTSSNITITQPGDISPDGETLVQKIVENTTTNYHALIARWNAEVGKKYTFSFFAKAGERTHLRVRHALSGWDMAIKVDLANGVIVDASVGSGSAYRNVEKSSIQAVGDYFRVTYTVEAASTVEATTYMFLDDDTTGTSATGNPTYTGDGISGLFIWGLQCEEGDLPTSIIPTVNAIATRLKPTIEYLFPVDYVGDFSVFIDLPFRDKNDSSGSTTFFNIVETSDNSNYISFACLNLSGEPITVYSPNHGGYMWGTLTNGGANTPVKALIRYENNSLNFFINGEHKGVDHTLTVNQLKKIRLFISSVIVLKYKTFKFFDVGLTDQDCIDLTTL